MNNETANYFYLTSRSRLNKSLNSIVGVIQGIAIDGVLTPGENEFLKLWLDDNTSALNKHPYNEIAPTIREAISDGVLSEEERADILWLCTKLIEKDGYIDAITPSLQQLHGILTGIVADGQIREAELDGLREWIDENDHLKTCWPYDETDALITSVMSDRVIDEDEHKTLLKFFSEFISIQDDKTLTSPAILADNTITGICAICPEITFPGNTFVLTGTLAKYGRQEAKGIIQTLGGRVAGSVSKKTNYLIIGSEGNPCWMYACYGRKIERAINLRKQGSNVLFVHENDFVDSVLDHENTLEAHKF